jgi:hypothetical protein
MSGLILFTVLDYIQQPMPLIVDSYKKKISDDY